MSASRTAILEANKRVREGADPKRKLDMGETTFRIPEQDFFALRKMFPALASPDTKQRFEAWKKFRNSPFAAPYLVVRSPLQVRRSDKRIQVR